MKKEKKYQKKKSVLKREKVNCCINFEQTHTHTEQRNPLDLFGTPWRLFEFSVDGTVPHHVKVNFSSFFCV